MTLTLDGERGTCELPRSSVHVQSAQDSRICTYFAVRRTLKVEKFPATSRLISKRDLSSIQWWLIEHVGSSTYASRGKRQVSVEGHAPPCWLRGDTRKPLSFGRGPCGRRALIPKKHNTRITVLQRLYIRHRAHRGAGRALMSGSPIQLAARAALLDFTAASAVSTRSK